MACFKPLEGYRKIGGGVTFKRSESTGIFQSVPCGQCIGCRLDYGLMWGMRCVHEAREHDQNCFITLTYDDEHLPYGGSLVKEHHQKFMKKLRRRIEPRKIKAYLAGEYGEKLGRPHYHACLFGYDFPDKKLYRREPYPLYTSEILESLWGKGFCSVGELTFESAAYTARYCLKKVTGKRREEHYTRVVLETGELIHLVPEYAAISNGIGKEWYLKFGKQAFAYDEIIHEGRRRKPPRYYEEMLCRDEPELYEKVKTERMRFAKAHASDNTYERLRDKEIVKMAQAGMLKRSL